MDAALLDTDILSEVLKQRNPAVTQKATEYLNGHQRFTFSAITRFEIARGYTESRSQRLLARFAEFCRRSEVVPVSDDVIDRAIDLWAVARRGGHPHGDAGLLIAATALVQGRTLVTGNTAHFQWVPGLTLDDWRRP